MCVAVSETRATLEEVRSAVEAQTGASERLVSRHGEVEAARVSVSVAGAFLETERKGVLAAKGQLTKARIRRQHKGKAPLPISPPLSRPISNGVHLKRPSCVTWTPK